VKGFSLGKCILVLLVDGTCKVLSVRIEKGKKNFVDRLTTSEVEEHPIDGANAPTGFELFHVREESL
jgi:hypothetical protein